MFVMDIYVTVIVFLSICVQCSVTDYTCLCSYNVEKPVYRSADTSYSPIGYLYEFDCRNVISNTDFVWAQIEFEHMVGFVEKNAQTKEQVCPGTPPDEDRIFTTTFIITLEETVKTASLATTKVSMSPQVTVIDSSRQTTIESIRPTALSTPSEVSLILATVTETTDMLSTKTEVNTPLEYTAHSSGALLKTHSPASTTIYTTPGLISSTVNVISFPETTTRPSLQITPTATESALHGPFATKQLTLVSVKMTTSPPTDITPTLTNQISQLPTEISPTSTLQFSTPSMSFIRASVSEILSSGPIPISTYSTNPTLTTLTQQSATTSFEINSTVLWQLSTNISPTLTVNLTETTPISLAQTSTLLVTGFSITPTTFSVNKESIHLIQPSSTISLSAQSTITLVSSPLFTSIPAIINSALMSGPAASVTATKSIEISSTAMATVTASPTSSTSSVLSGRVDLCPYRLLALCYNTTNHDYPCFRQYGEYCYELRLQRENWFQARTDCQQRDGILLTVDSQAIQVLILEMIPKLSNNRKPDIWIGLNDVRLEQVWQWADGSPLNKTGFRPHFNLDTVYSDLKDCVVMDGNTGTWRQSECKSFLFNSAVHAWVCQYKI